MTDSGPGTIRDYFARRMAWASGSTDVPLRAAFRSVRPEDFLPTAPWRLHLHGAYSVERSPDETATPIYPEVWFSVAAPPDSA